MQNGKFDLQIKYVIVVLLVLLASCGKKTGLIVYDDSAPEPELTQVSFQTSATTFDLFLSIQGGSGAVWYEVDRAEIDPSCNCIAGWLRYYESSPSAQRSGLEHHFKLRMQGMVYAFRVRAVDSIGRKTAWSKVMKTEAHHEEGGR